MGLGRGNYKVKKKEESGETRMKYGEPGEKRKEESEKKSRKEPGRAGNASKKDQYIATIVFRIRMAVFGGLSELLTDGRTDEHTDTVSFKNARTHLKTLMVSEETGGKYGKIKKGIKRKTGERGIEKQKNKAGYTAQDAPSMRTFHLRK